MSLYKSLELLVLFGALNEELALLELEEDDDTGVDVDVDGAGLSGGF